MQQSQGPAGRWHAWWADVSKTARIGAIAGVIFMVCAGCGAASTSTVAQHTASPSPTAKRATPTPKPAQSGPTVIGGLDSAFIAKYGQPNNHSDTSNGMLHFARYSGSNIDAVIIWLDPFDGPALAHHVISVTLAAPDNGPSWSLSFAESYCQTFAPTDAQIKQRMPVTGSTGVQGLDVIEYSATLAATFPASEFVDASQTAVQPGLFDILYLYPSATQTEQVDSCDLLLGTQQTTG